MKTVWKFTLNAPDQPIEMPEGAIILTIHGQHNSATIWALVEPAAPKEWRRFLTIGTGQTIPGDIDNLKPIGTFGISNWEFVYHVFEVVTTPDIDATFIGFIAKKVAAMTPEEKQALLDDLSKETP